VFSDIQREKSEIDSLEPETKHLIKHGPVYQLVEQKTRVHEEGIYSCRIKKKVI
jgi:hypothetical protein